LEGVDSTGKTISPGGFVEDWEKGLLWVLIDFNKNEVVDGSFNPSQLIKKAVEYIKKEGKFREPTDRSVLNVE